MEQYPTFHQHMNTAKMLLEQGRDNAFIESHLQQQGLDSNLLSSILEQVKRLRNAKRTQNGSMLILAGVVLLGLGFVSCIFLHDAGASVDFALYGLTAIGAVVLVAGLAMIFH
ncbi:MAG: hypothetical protein IT234_04360 [Bacteroidia bacterium]|nr:hypothetical protein [Bacteroidia bacterium]